MMNDSHDPLAQFRKKPITPASGLLPPKDLEAYSAFDTKDKVRRLKIHSGDSMTHCPGYNLLLDIVSDGRHGTNFILVFTCLLVMVRGRNLQKAVHALEMGVADYIQVFDPERWPKPTDTNAAIIDSIEVKMTDKGNSEAAE